MFSYLAASVNLTYRSSRSHLLEMQVFRIAQDFQILKFHSVSCRGTTSSLSHNGITQEVQCTIVPIH